VRRRVVDKPQYDCLRLGIRSATRLHETRPIGLLTPYLTLSCGNKASESFRRLEDAEVGAVPPGRRAVGLKNGSLHRHHRAAEFKKFLARIDKTVPAGLEVHLVCDNLSTHKAPAIREWLTRHPRFRLHFTPTGSSWINQVERWFGLLTDQKIRRGVHTSVPTLEADIRNRIESWNANPRPFTWTKTADEILDSLAKYIAKISGAAY
jgi:transposase